MLETAIELRISRCTAGAIGLMDGEAIIVSGFF
jgi:hypothetical protein